MACKCFVAINTFLADYDAELLTNLFGPPRAVVSTYQEKKPGRRLKKPPLVFATFCPFCGKKYPKHKE